MVICYEAAKLAAFFFGAGVPSLRDSLGEVRGYPALPCRAVPCRPSGAGVACRSESGRPRLFFGEVPVPSLRDSVGEVRSSPALPCRAVLCRPFGAGLIWRSRECGTPLGRNAALPGLKGSIEGRVGTRLSYAAPSGLDSSGEAESVALDSQRTGRSLDYPRTPRSRGGRSLSTGEWGTRLSHGPPGLEPIFWDSRGCPMPPLRGWSRYPG